MTLTVVTGPPAAGKSTWVMAHAKPGDIVIDYDRIAQALTAEGADTHRHGRAVKRVTYKAWWAAITEALPLSARCDVYVIHSTPNAEALARYKQHGARIVPVDPGRDVVMRRIGEQRPGGAAGAVERWYMNATTAPTGTPPSRQW